MGKRKDWFMGKSESPSDDYKNAKEWFIGTKEVKPVPEKKNKGCPSCGRTGLFSKPNIACASCGKIFCEKCAPSWYRDFSYKKQTETDSSPAIYGKSGFCSKQCHENFSNTINSFSTRNIVGTDVSRFQANVIDSFNQAILNAITDFYKPTMEAAIRMHTSINPAFPIFDAQTKKYGPIYLLFYNKAKLELAENLEKCGRIQDSAKIYEELQIYDKSRQLRQQDKSIIVKNTNVSVNLNSLLQQVKDGGIVAVFRCPFCGGKLKINENTTLNSLMKCEHCNSDIKAMDLEDFLKAVL
jgi:hypothetical protein